MFDYMMEAYGTKTPEDVKKAQQEKYRLEMKVRNLEQVIKYSAPENFDALMDQLEQARTDLCEVTERTSNLLTKWRYEQAKKTWEQLYPGSTKCEKRQGMLKSGELQMESWRRFH